MNLANTHRKRKVLPHALLFLKMQAYLRAGRQQFRSLNQELNANKSTSAADMLLGASKLLNKGIKEFEGARS